MSQKAISVSCTRYDCFANDSGGESLEISEQELIDMYINGHQKEGESNGE